MVPSLDRSSLLQPRTNYWNIKTVVHKLAIGRHIRLMSCKKHVYLWNWRHFQQVKLLLSHLSQICHASSVLRLHIMHLSLFITVFQKMVIILELDFVDTSMFGEINDGLPVGDRICNCQILSMLIFFLRSLVCNPDLQDPPLVFIVAFLTNSLLYHQKRRVNYMWFFIDKCFFASWLWLRMLLL